MKIIKYAPQYQQQFEQLNRAWVEKYFEVEPMDEALLSDPEEAILNKGGQIFFVLHENQIIGTVALVCMGTGVYEMAKMAVDERFQGLGAGKLLCRTAIDEAKKRGAHKLVLFTNTKLTTAIAIYRRFGFTDVVLDGQEYSRADTKMELLLKPAVRKWFDRQFNFGLGRKDFPALLSRMENAALKVKEITQGLSEDHLHFKPDGKWSIKEHIGHLWILERLWQTRFLEIKENKAEMSPADLSNAATDKALFNQRRLEHILSGFEQERQHTIRTLSAFDDDDFLYRLYHPRLNHPMTVADLMYFVAEHDDHHLHAIRDVMDKLTENIPGRRKG